MLSGQGGRVAGEAGGVLHHGGSGTKLLQLLLVIRGGNMRIF